MGELREYGEREQKRTDHLREVVAYAGWRAMDTGFAGCVRCPSPVVVALVAWGG